MKDFVKEVVNNGEFLLNDILKEWLGVNHSRTSMGVWVEEGRLWKNVKVYRKEIMAEAEKRGLVVSFSEKRKAVHFKYRD